jgi:hypothetical protein
MPRRELALAVGALLLLALPLLAWGWGGLSRTGLPLALSLTLLALVASVAYRDYAAGKFDLFQPVLWKGLLFFVPNFVLKTWHIIFFGPDKEWLNKIDHWDYFFSFSLLTGLLAYLVMALGYYWFPCRRQIMGLLFKFKGRPLNPWGLKWPTFLLFLLGVAASYFLLRTGTLGYTDFRESGPITHIIQQFSKYNLYALFIFLWAWLGIRAPRGFSWLALLACMAFCQLVLGFLIGSRGYLFLNGLAVLAVLYYRGWLRGRFSRLVCSASLVAFLLVLGFVFATPFREVKYKLVGFDQPYGLGEAMTIYQGIIKSQEIGVKPETIIYFQYLLFKRANNMESLAVVLERADKVQHLEAAYGIRYNMAKEFFWGLVPRFVYPAKPILSEFAVEFGHLYHDLPPFMRSWSNPTIMGDLFRNLGYAGILAGMFILGFFLRWLYVVLVEHNRNPLLLMVYFFSLMNLNFEGTYIGLYHGVLRLWVMLALFDILLLWLYPYRRARIISGLNMQRIQAQG